MNPPSLFASASTALLCASLLIGCAATTTPDTVTPPADPTFELSVPLPAAPAYVDYVRAAPSAGDAAVQVLAGFNDLWTPGTTWDSGTVKNSAVLNANIGYVERVTRARTQQQELDAYYDDRRNQSYSVISGLGPLTDLYRAGAQSVTTIRPYSDYADFAAWRAATTAAKEDDAGSGLPGGNPDSALGDVVKLVAATRSVSTTPGKNTYQYPRPWRQSAAVIVAPSLEKAKSSTPATDGGYPSGHTNAGYLAALALAYAVPERYQELLTRASDLGEGRILAGMHSPLDVIGARMMATAHAAAVLSDPANATLKLNAYTQAHAYLQAQTNTDQSTFFAAAHAGTTATDAYASAPRNRAAYQSRLTYSLPRTGPSGVTASVPKNAEVLLETRLPYLSAQQRRAALQTTALDSGFPVMDDPEGWGRLNLYAAADGYGAIEENVNVSMDAGRGGFHARDEWRNDMGGTGKLNKRGSGHLTLSGANTYAGGTQLHAGTLEAASATALGRGDVFLSGGTLIDSAPGGLKVTGRFTQRPGSALQLNLGSGAQGRLNVTGDVQLAGTLTVTLAGDVPSGDTLTVITGTRVSGRFASVTAGGRTVTPIYTANAVQLRVE